MYVGIYIIFCIFQTSICSLVLKFQHQKMLFLLFFVGILAPTITDAHSIQLHEEPKTDFRTIFETYDPGNFIVFQNYSKLCKSFEF